VKLPARWRTRVRLWSRRRQGEDAPPFALQRRRLYILPTRAGLAFAGLVAVMLLAGLNYNNSLGLLLGFLLVGFGLVAMYECHRNLQGLHVIAADAADVFAGEHIDVSLAIENSLATSRHAIVLRAEDRPSADAGVDLAARETGALHCALPARQRGRQRIEALEISSTQPAGLFRCWTWLHLPLEAIIYPAARGDAPLPIPRGEPMTSGAQLDSGEEEWAALRPYQPGDNPRAVAWKAYARGAPLLVARYEAVRGGEHRFDVATAPGANLEARLSQIAAWVLVAEARKEPYGLRVGDTELAADLGTFHRQRCLRALALC
jgi:uncharacterized protein (DUF58 family)